MTRKRFHGLKQIKVRQTWNKYNLYNLSRLPQVSTKVTFYQQKWKAKSATRAYHGEHIREKQWQRMFRSRLPAVVPMDHRYLAEHDGSELASGRGSGREQPLDFRGRAGRRQIPYMNMTYAPIERRLDSAIFRALFASSARQARQFVIHGKVKVNGKKMIYPGYLLNPGDMFQVEPDRVLFATGAPKPRDQARRGRSLRRALGRKKVVTQKRARPRRKPAEGDTESGTEVRTREILSRSVVNPTLTATHGDREIAEIRAERKVELKQLMTKAQAVLENKRYPPSAKRKQRLRTLTKSLRSAMSQVNKRSIDQLAKEHEGFISELSACSAPRGQDKKVDEDGQEEELNSSPEEERALREAIARARENPIDETKPYATPWHPRPYMSPFAFIPRYLEVNQNICAAVYLRHPVARPGIAEVPSPFGAETQQLAFTWYLRRR